MIFDKMSRDDMICDYMKCQDDMKKEDDME